MSFFVCIPNHIPSGNWMDILQLKSFMRSLHACLRSSDQRSPKWVFGFKIECENERNTRSNCQFIFCFQCQYAVEVLRLVLLSFSHSILKPNT